MSMARWRRQQRSNARPILPTSSVTERTAVVVSVAVTAMLLLHQPAPTHGQAFCVDGETNCTATTLRLSEIFMGRCYGYEFVNGSCHTGTPGEDRCSSAWGAFFEGTAQNTDGSYSFDSLLNIIPPVSLPDKTVFWSGLEFNTKVIQSELLQQAAFYAVGHGSTALELTQLGSMLNGLNFCRNPSAPDEFLYDSCCPRFSDTPAGPRTAFWQQISMAYARQARGDVSVIMRQPAHRPILFSESSVLYAELNALNEPPAGTKANVYVLEWDGCKDKSLQNAKRILVERGFTWSCEDRGSTVESMACSLGTATQPFCERLRKPNTTGISPGEAAGIAIGSILIGIVISLVLYAYIKRRNLSNFMLQFSDSPEELELMVDDPDDYNSEYISFTDKK